MQSASSYTPTPTSTCWLYITLTAGKVVPLAGLPRPHLLQKESQLAPLFQACLLRPFPPPKGSEVTPPLDEGRTAKPFMCRTA